jgi:hypothetical protein
MNTKPSKKVSDTLTFPIYTLRQKFKYLHKEITYIQWRREEVKAEGPYFENGRKCETNVNK